jgi:MFS family permease
VFFGWLGEGALTDWAPIFMTVVVGSSAAVAAAVSSAYGFLMTVARFGGDAVVERFGARRVLVASTASAALAVSVATAFPSLAVTVITFALAGAAIANLSPLVFSLGGRYGAAAVGTLTSLGYAAFLGGPALLGGAAHVAGLREAFVLPIVALAISTVLAARFRPEGRS